MPEVKEKICSTCKTAKAASEFSKSKRFSDGLSKRCKVCSKIYMHRWKERQKKGGKMPEDQKEKCSMCGMIKPTEEMSEIVSTCESCNAIFKDVKKSQAMDNLRAVRVETWEQVGSLLRAMSETRYAIQVEDARTRARIAAMRESLSETTKSWAKRNIEQALMIESFIKRNNIKSMDFSKRMRFGLIKVENGKLSIRLFPHRAYQRLGKP